MQTSEQNDTDISKCKGMKREGKKLTKAIDALNGEIVQQRHRSIAVGIIRIGESGLNARNQLELIRE